MYLECWLVHLAASTEYTWAEHSQLWYSLQSLLLYISYSKIQLTSGQLSCLKFQLILTAGSIWCCNQMTILLCDLYYYLLQVLSDEDKRSLYDRFGEEGLSGDYRDGDIGTHGVHNLFSTKSFSFLTSLIPILGYKFIFL